MPVLATGAIKKQTVSRFGSQNVSKIELKIIREYISGGFASKRWIL